jgi:hypothetical protein
MSASSEALDHLRKGRSQLSNGSRLFLQGDLDGRSSAARRFRDVLDALYAHLGGSDAITEPRRHLARRCAGLVVWCEAAEGRLVVDDGVDFDVGLYALASNSLRRLLGDLGLDGVPRDITPSGLSRYLTVDAEAEPVADDAASSRERRTRNPRPRVSAEEGTSG